MLIEVIVTSVEEAIQAQEFGANRLELIHAFELGGLSADLGLSKQVCEAVNIPVNVMLRPHGHSFVYDQNEVSQIIEELRYLRDYTKTNAVVFGALTNENKLDTMLLEQIIKQKEQLGLVFHRAIDVSYDPLRVYEELLEYKEVDNVLTSGGADTAENGVEIIKQMVNLRDRLSQANILVGSGITPDNAKYIVEQTGVKQIHVGTGVRTNRALDKHKFEQLLALFR